MKQQELNQQNFVTNQLRQVERKVKERLTMMKNQTNERSLKMKKKLERKFSSWVGISPRHYLKITRFKAAVNLLRNKNFLKFSDVAYQLHYFDQAHFIKNVKELSGLSPRKLQKQLQASLANLII